VLGGNYSSTKHVNSIQQLIAFSLITGTKVDIGQIIYSDLGSDYTRDENFRFLPPIMSNSNFTKDPSKVTDIELTTHMIVVNSQKDSVSPLPLAAKPKKGKSQTMNPTLPKLQGHKVPRALSKKSKRPKYLTSTTSDEGTTKITPRLEGSLGDKDSRGNIPPLYMEPIHPTVANLSGTGAKYKVESDEEEVLAAGEDMDEDIQVAEEVRTPSPKQDQLEPSNAAVSYADLKASIKEYYDENVAHKDQTNKLVETTMSATDKSSTTIKDLYTGLNLITQLLKDINNAVKDDPAINKKIDDAIKTFSKISTTTTTEDTSEIKSMMTEIYQAFKGQSTPSSSVPQTTLALTTGTTTVGGRENVTEEPPSCVEG
ncbi:hypothetical protein Tco_1462800, partial [Tanacetum coccineum]